MTGTAGRPVEVSVIVPVRDVEETVALQLDGLASQLTPRVWEAIVVDNGSIDRTRAIVAARLPSLPGGQLITAAEPGVAAARHAGVAVAAGEKLLFCDGDDQVTAGWVEAMAAALDDATLVGGCLDRRALNDPARIVPGSARSTSLPRYCGFVPFAVGASIGVRRSLYDELGGFRGEINGAEDAEFAIRAHERGVTAAFVPDAVTHYRDRPTSRAVFLQYWRHGLMDAPIYRQYRHLGLGRRTLGGLTRYWLRTAVIGLRGVRSGPHRVQFVRRTGRGLGRLAGALRHRIVYA